MATAQLIEINTLDKTPKASIDAQYKINVNKDDILKYYDENLKK